MRDFFHIDRVNGTIEEERILWREVAAAPGKKENIFAFKKREKRSERGTFPRVSSITVTGEEKRRSTTAPRKK